MKAEIDPDLCIGCGICPEVCPEVFSLPEDIATVLTETVPEAAEKACLDAAEQCPVDAIIIKD